MSNAKDADGKLLSDAERLTPFCDWLRTHGLDELPQLFNVLRGDVGLVGPRPLHIRYVPLYTPAQFRRHEVRPGVTGWAQINGRDAISWEEKFKLDLWYIEHLSLGLDLKILFRTFWLLVAHRKPSGAGFTVMPEFTGSIPADGADRRSQEKTFDN